MRSLTARSGSRFNPLPARRPGATFVWADFHHGWMLFQSSPSPKAGSYMFYMANLCNILGFNPLPARRPGATNQLFEYCSIGNVSILSQPEGRELLEIRGFQITIIKVSILSQPEGRELLSMMIS